MQLPNFTRLILGILPLALGGLLPCSAWAQTTYTENFTGAATNNSWYFINGACLTAGSSTSQTSPGIIPSCVSIFNSYYKPKGDSSLVGGNTGTLPDNPTLGGALRFTNGYPGGYNENGAILSAFTFPTTNGIQVSFTTETYRGNSAGPSVGDGADGMSFFLQSTDQNQTPDIGDFGGSLGYTCSNANYDGTVRTTGPTAGQPRGYDGMIGGYIGLGIDEYGNFLNPGDNTSTGPGYQGNRIGLRGAGSTAWIYLNATYPNQYPSTLTNAQRASAVQQACQKGVVYDWSAVGAWNSNNVNALGVAIPQPTPVVYPNPNNGNAPIPLQNYAAIPGAYKILGTTVKIANEAAIYRGPGVNGATGTAYGVPITYNVTITPSGLLSLSYSYNGGVYQPVITGQSITASNGSLPNNVRFGFAGSTGGGTNIHEIMCFSAQPASQTSVTAGINQKQSAKVQVGSQIYFAFYNSNNWPGSLTSLSLEPSPTDPTTLIISPTANWDASCVLTGVSATGTCAATAAAGPIPAEAPANRTILTWNGSQGIPFEWTNLTSAQQAALDTGDATVTPLRLNYLRGDRSNELTSAGVGLYRARTSVLGDIIDSSPTWVGPPTAGYPATWTDLYPNGGSTPAPTPPENSGSAQTYPAFTTAEQTRTNVVFSGANDGLMHGFRSGSFTTPTSYDGTYNDGQEVIAYMPGVVVNNINANANVSNDFSNFQYAHHFSVDATPGTGDLFYNNQWHTWLVSGLGPGGNAIFALDITNPGTGNTNNFTEAGAGPQTTVIGEWSTTTTTTTTSTGTTTSTTSTITCVNVSACGNNLGKTYGTPQIRRFHNGNWGFIVGNGFGSVTGDAGIYVVTVDSTTGALTWRYLSTGQAGTADGIAFPAGADLDGDHITDYVYAGDLLGNLWRFDLTDSNPNNWAVTPTPLYTTTNSEPITTKPIILINYSSAVPRVLVEFGTGRQIPMTNTAAATYATTQQGLYGIWDWNFSVWNAKASISFASMPATTSKPTLSNLQQQTITASYNAALSSTGSAYRTVSNYNVCYADTTGCSQYGWYLMLPIGQADPTNPISPTVAEQVLFAPALLSGVFVVNTTVPSSNTPTTCSSTAALAWTMALDPLTGGALSSSYFQLANGTYVNVTTTNANGQTTAQGVSGVADLGTGTPTEVVFNGQQYMISSQVTSGSGNSSSNPTVTGPPTGMCPAGTTICPYKHHHVNVAGQRVTWVERR